jgi:beta-aspartyl-peptidase (threonine type)
MMMRQLILLMIFGLVLSSNLQPEGPEKAIRTVLDKQVAAWNNGNLDEFMTGYWKSPALKIRSVLPPLIR